MKKDSLVDYLACIVVRLIGPLIRKLPLGFSLFLGGRLGDLLYGFDLRHRAVVYSNLKAAFGKVLSPRQLSKLSREFYLAFGQNLMEIFLIPLVDEEYVNKYISLQGSQFVEDAFRLGKGVIFVSVHAGSWELSNIICANLGFPFNVLVRDQRYPRLNALLNRYRTRRGCKLIQRQNSILQLIEALKNNESIGITIDQGGKKGLAVKFFGRSASMATGALRLALKYDSVILPAFYTRVKGPYIKTIIAPPFQLQKTGDLEKDLQDNLQQLIYIFEKFIARYPKEYLWSYKIFKYSNERNILVLSDGITGHLRQAEALVNIASKYFKEKDIEHRVDIQEVKFKNRFSRSALAFSSSLSGKYHCQGCLWCLRTFLKDDVYKSLLARRPELIISCGSSLAPINYILSRENLAKSVVIMRPSFLSVLRFDLAIIPIHDKPPKRKNVVATEGSLNLIDEQYLKEESQRLIQAQGLGLSAENLYIGFLVGGDTNKFSLSQDTVLRVIKEIKSASKKFNAGILVSTSRRTSPEIENIVKQELKDCPACKLLVIANEKNIPGVVGGILGLSQIIISSPESISMISEAISSRRYVLVFNLPRLSRRHQVFLKASAKNKYIYLSEVSNLSQAIEDVWRDKPAIHTTRDNFLVSEAIKKIL